MIDLLVCYDVETVTAAGRRRLRRMARACLRYGGRVQDSVFECRVTRKSLDRLLARLSQEMDPKQDSVRLYFLHGARTDYVLALGVDRGLDLDGPLVFGS